MLYLSFFGNFEKYMSNPSNPVFALVRRLNTWRTKPCLGTMSMALIRKSAAREERKAGYGVLSGTILWDCVECLGGDREGQELTNNINFHPHKFRPP